MTDSAYMGSESTYSECETFTDEDTSTLVHPELQPEGDADSAGGSAVPSECLDTMEEPDQGALLLLPGRCVPQQHTHTCTCTVGGMLCRISPRNKTVISPPTVFPTKKCSPDCG